MKTNHTRSGWRWAVFVLLFSLMTQGVLVGVVRGQDAVTTAQGISTPLYIGNLEPLMDPYGRPMPGSHAGPIQSRVELRVATNNWVIPPHINGMSHPFNPVLQDCTGGMGLNTCNTNNGLFCMVLPTRPGEDVQVFARAYNAPTPAEIPRLHLGWQPHSLIPKLAAPNRRFAPPQKKDHFVYYWIETGGMSYIVF